MKFHHQMRAFVQMRAGILVEGAGRIAIDKLDPGHGNARLDGGGHAFDGLIQRRETANGRDDLLGLAMQAQGQLSNDAQRALGSDKQPGQVVTGAGFRRPRAGADHRAIGQHHLKRQNIVTHGAIAHGGGAAGPRRGHAAKTGIGARIDRKEQPRRAQFGIQRLTRDAGLKADLHILGPDFKHAVHLHHIDDQPALRGQRVPLQRGAGAPADHRHLMGVTDRQHPRHLVGRNRPGHGIGGRRGVKGLGLAVLITVGGAGRKARAQKRGKRVKRRCGDRHGDLLKMLWHLIGPALPQGQAWQLDAGGAL